MQIIILLCFVISRLSIGRAQNLIFKFWYRSVFIRPCTRYTNTLYCVMIMSGVIACKGFEK